MAYIPSVQVDAPQPGFAALGDPTRRAIIGLLQARVLTVGELAAQLTVSRPAVSQHLKRLKQAELVREERSGTRHYFGLNASGFEDLRKQIDGLWQSALTSFAAYVAQQESLKKQPSRRAKGKDSK